MKLDVMRPQTSSTSTRSTARPMGVSTVDQTGLRLGALVRMADAAEHR